MPGTNQRPAARTQVPSSTLRRLAVRLRGELPELRILAADLDIQETRFISRIGGRDPATLTGADANERDLLAQARGCVEAGDVGSGWRFLQEARTLDLAYLSADERAQHAKWLRAYAERAIESPGRAEAIKDLLKGTSASAVQRANRLRAADLADTYHRIHEIQSQRRWLLVWLLGIFSGFVLLARFGGVPVGPDDVGMGWRLLVAVLLAGALGGTLSALSTLVWHRDYDLPRQWLANLTLSVRMLVGAGTALAVHLIALSDFFTFEPQSGGQALGVAVVAGLSESLVLKMAQRGADLVLARRRKGAPKRD